MIEYLTNNSGGHWWLTDANWKALEDAGWNVQWQAGPDSLHQESFSSYEAVKEYELAHRGENVRFLGSIARSATRDGLSMEEAIAEWESVTGLDSEDEGCPCCGEPHNFYNGASYEENS
jgi:hypothetical protein